MTEAERLGKIARDLCDAIGEEHNLVRSILVEPRSCTFSVYELNADSHKFVKADGTIAMRTITRPLEWPTP